MKIRKLIQTIGVILFLIGLFKFHVSALLICHYFNPAFLADFLGSQARTPAKLGSPFIIGTIIEFLIILAGFGLWRVKRMGIWALYSACLAHLFTGFFYGIYQETLVQMLGHQYNLTGKILLVLMMASIYLLPLALVAFFFGLKIVSRVFDEGSLRAS